MKSPEEVGAKVTGHFVNSIREHLIDADLGIEESEIKLIDHDEATLYFGLFELDETAEVLQSDPTIIWSIEVFADLKGGR